MVFCASRLAGGTLEQRRLQEVCLLSLSVADDGMPDWANLVGKPVLINPSNGRDLAGGGVYACFWDGILIYIGSFVGPKGDPLGGHVAERIYKHAIGFTLRARQLGFSKRPLRSIMTNLDHPIARELQGKRKASDRLEQGSIKATYNKARFAARHWEDLRNASPKMLSERFTFVYRRIAPAFSPHDKQLVKERWIKPIERRLVRRFEPICNTEFRAGPDGPPVGFSQVAEAFEEEFAVPLLKLSETASQVPASQDSNSGPDDDDDDDREVIPADPRWREYYTADGQLRVRAVSGVGGLAKGRMLLYRESVKRIICLATVDSLAAVGIKAEQVQRGPLVSSVAVDFDGDPGERSTLLREVLQASLAVLGG